MISINHGELAFRGTNEDVFIDTLIIFTELMESNPEMLVALFAAKRKEIAYALEHLTPEQEQIVKTLITVVEKFDNERSE